jgi:hypothetical protein
VGVTSCDGGNVLEQFWSLCGWLAGAAIALAVGAAATSKLAVMRHRASRKRIGLVIGELLFCLVMMIGARLCLGPKNKKLSTCFSITVEPGQKQERMEIQLSTAGVSAMIRHCDKANVGLPPCSLVALLYHDWGSRKAEELDLTGPRRRLF